MTQRWKPFALVLAWMTCLLWGSAAVAAPSAKIIRVDPQPVIDGSTLTMRMVVDLGEPRSPSAGLAPCGPPSKRLEYLACAADVLQKPDASYAQIAWPPHDKLDAPPDTAVEEVEVGLLTTVDGADAPATLVSRERWGALSKTDEKIGTAYLILIDASNTMGGRLGNAKAVARALVEARGKNDIFNVKSFNDSTWFAGSGWTNDPKAINEAIEAIYMAEEAPGRSRPLFDLIKNAALEGFGELGNRAQKPPTPLHHALAVLSDAWAGTDFGGSPPALAQQLGRLFADGILDEHNATAPRTPVPVLSVWFPAAGFEEAFENARQFMQNLSVTSIGGAFYIVPDQAGTRGKAIAQLTKKRFDAMHVLQWKVPCLEAGTSQSFKLLFKNAEKPILGDGWTGVPVAADPRKWTLDIDAALSAGAADRHPLEPGGTATIFGNFCWGNDPARAEVYIVPKDQKLPDASEDEAEARRARDELTARGLRATPIRSGDNYVEVRLPDKDEVVGDGTTRIVVLDGKAKRSSPATPDGVLTLKSRDASGGSRFILELIFAVLVLGLLVANLLRGGGAAGRRRQTVMPSRPVVAGASSVDGERPSGIMPVPSMPLPSSNPVPSAPVASPAPMVSPAPMATVMFAGGAPPGGVRIARLGGSAGVFPVAPGREYRIGRDPGACDIPLRDAAVSGSHARVKIEGGRLLVMDDDSSHGTFVNGGRLAPRAWSPVPHGAVLRFGAVDLMVQLE